MQGTKGRFIVLEGTDGSGKGTQFLKLITRLKEEGTEPATFDFPRYDHPSSWFVREYLSGTFNQFETVGAKTASLFYALDRYAASPSLKTALKLGRLVISNRYVASNLGHQGAKMHSPEERLAYFKWDMELEYEINNIPRPDMNLILHVPAEIAQKLVDQKLARKYLGGVQKRDLHEADLGHLLRAEETYKQLADVYPDEFKLIECVEGGELLSIDEIHEKVWAEVKKILPS